MMNIISLEGGGWWFNPLEDTLKTYFFKNPQYLTIIHSKYFILSWLYFLENFENTIVHLKHLYDQFRLLDNNYS